NDSWTVVSAPTASASGYGTFTVTSDGVWTYTLDDNNATVQTLNVGDTLTDTFTVATADGTTQLVTITIEGANDAAVTSGDMTGFLTTSGGVPATGDLNSADVDNVSDVWTAVTSPTTSDDGFGSYTIDASGHWTYTVDPNDPDLFALRGDN